MSESSIDNRQSSIGNPGSPGLLGESLITLADAAERIGRITGRRPNTSTLWRWASRGIRSRRRGSAKKVRLETMRIGSHRYTSIEAIERFSAALDGRAVRTRAAGGGRRSEVTRERAVEAARARLAAMGWM